ncbi:hypothetical protein HIM_03907 [Hirsutella minnesotensis 3608]|uniref:RNB domain-containing protein n=1 Tax=Hirsutella minnesotensis 3608 TaxID=1043627 RepID=A0A0F7ZLN6_9HYPO|nr:hypothetical protein HIM_03907 [Hirsutella minnesotensis 3608]
MRDKAFSNALPGASTTSIPAGPTTYSCNAVETLPTHNAPDGRRTATQFTGSNPSTFGQTNIPKAKIVGKPPPKPARNQYCRKVPIRDSLKQWEKEHCDEALPELPQDLPLFGGPTNTLNRTQTTGSSSLNQLRFKTVDVDDFTGYMDGNDAEGVFVGLGPRNPGDLVELRQLGSRVPLFGIYLGFYSGLHHFYAVNGKWVTSLGLSFPFAVPNFTTVESLAPIVAKVPRNASPDEITDMQQQGLGPMREDARELILKMTDFRDKAETIYQSNITILEGAKTILPHQEKFTHLSLAEIADRLLPSSLRGADGFPPEALYAVQTALMRVEVGFRPINPTGDCSRPENLFEILPHSCLTTLDNVATLVREYTDAASKKRLALGHQALDKVTLGVFLQQARTAVLQSRQKREWSQHGILKASSGTELPQVDWTSSSQDIISFLAWWASFDMFHTSSRFHSYGAIILRGLGLYKQADLNQSTAWTFLQEIGRIPPWEIPTRYRTRLPGVSFVKGGGLSREMPDQLQASKRPDIAAGARTQSGSQPVLCIDAPSTMVIDDGISLERTQEPDVFWVHVHAADPASVIKPDSELCKFLELIPENIYLPGHFQAMLPSDLGEDNASDYKSEGLVKQFSLHSGGPALTFSTKINSAGDILDYQIQPSVLGDVLYLDPDDVARFCNEQTPAFSAERVLSVGTLPAQGEPAPGRPMVAVDNLDASKKEDIQTLYKLAQALKQMRLSKGAWPYFAPRPSVSVAFNPVPESKETPHPQTDTIPADPWIKVSTEASSGCSVVSEFMVLAGRVAACWCSDRGIPLPYRRDAKSAENYEAALAYATEELYPLIHNGIEPNREQRQELIRYTGKPTISSEPGSYFILGIDKYTKATSPLRRFSDLLVHWQIHAALATERTNKRPLDPNVDNLEDILPFNAATLDTTLPLLQMREKMGKAMSQGVLDWILIALVRAWRFEGKVPEALRFKVVSRLPSALLGSLNLFNLSAVIDIDGLEGCRLLKDVRVGDAFDVELVDVNVHSRTIRLKALRYLGQEATDGPSNPNSGGSEAPLA